MATPLKPWNNPRGGSIGFGLNQRQASFHPDQNNSFMSTQDFGNGGGGSSSNGGAPLVGGRPSVPPRPTNYGNAVSRPTGMYNSGYSSYSSYGGYGGSAYGHGGMGGYGGYGSPGGYGGYNRLGMMGNGVPDENGFIQVAEESSRQAFQSIESIVHAFGSVSMMLESTYHAVYSSFRAVLGVAEHFSRMKSHFAQIFSALAVVRTLRWILKKLLYLIGLRSQDPSLEAVWRAAANGAASSSALTEADLKASRSSWPIVMFLGVVFGGPYLIWRLLSSLVKPAVQPKSHGWKKGVSDHYAAVAVYSFQGANNKELSFQNGQQLFLAPRDIQPQLRGWLLASNGSHVGLVPANYIKILGLRQGSPQPVNSLPQPISHPDRGRVAPRIPGMPLNQERHYPPSVASSVTENAAAVHSGSLNTNASEISGQNTPSSETSLEDPAFPGSDAEEPEGTKNTSDGENSDSSFVKIDHQNVDKDEDV